MRTLLLPIIITFSFIYAEEWIYYNSIEGVSRVTPDGLENELMIENAILKDMSLDKSKLLALGGTQAITIVDIESMNIQTVQFSEESLIYPSDLHFTYDENVILFSDMSYNLYKYSFIDNLLTLIYTGGTEESSFVNGSHSYITMSPEKDKATFLKSENQDIINLMIVDIQSNETSILETLPSFGHECNSNFYGYQTHWSEDEYIYFTTCGTDTQLQLLKKHSLNSNPSQLLVNEIFSFLKTDDTHLEKLVFQKPPNDLESLLTVEYWTVDLESSETLYFENMFIEIEQDFGFCCGGVDDYPFMWTNQTWSLDNSKVAISGLVFGGFSFTNFSNVGIHIFDTVTESIMQITPSGGYSYSVGPIFWVGYSVNGDVNGDGIVNVLDIVQVVNLALANEYEENGDLNGDGIVNVLDIVQLLNIILN